MFEQLKAQQEEMKQKLRTIEVVEESQGIRVTVSADQRVRNITIDPAVLSGGDAEELEDLLMVVINRALEKATEKGAVEMQSQMKDMLGGAGLGSMFSKLF